MIEAVVAIALGLGLAVGLIVQEFRHAAMTPPIDGAKLISRHIAGAPSSRR